MNFKEYSEKALRTAGMYDTVYDQMENAALGMTGEAGEVADIIKKFKFQGHELSEEEIAKECGDQLWYINLMANAIGKSLEEIAAMNIEKLEKRYPTNQFRVEDSVNRVV
jgi:NTP pyrophosphatase (non-canonical NTP hydrolase)